MVSPRLIAKIESEAAALRLAVLIDADNAQAAVIDGLLAEIAKFGEATVKRIYSDFTGLAMRLREAGLTVLGFGEKKTPEAFRNACHKFIFTEVLRPTAAVPIEEQPELLREQKAAPAQASADAAAQFPKDFLLDALEKAGDDQGWAHLGTFGSYLTKLKPDFDPRQYGFKKLSDLIKSRPDIFQTEERQAQGSQQKNLYLHAK